MSLEGYILLWQQSVMELINTKSSGTDVLYCKAPRPLVSSFHFHNPGLVIAFANRLYHLLYIPFFQNYKVFLRKCVSSWNNCFVKMCSEKINKFWIAKTFSFLLLFKAVLSMPNPYIVRRRAKVSFTRIVNLYIFRRYMSYTADSLLNRTQ